MTPRCALMILLATLVHPDVGAEIPDPDGMPAAQDKPVKVFILLGQSNMLGFGRPGPADMPGTLEYMIKEKNKYPHKETE